MLQRRQLQLVTGAWWLAWIELHAGVLYFSGQPFVTSLADSLVSVGLLAAGSYVIWTILRFYRPSGSKIMQVVAWCVVISAGAWALSVGTLRMVFSSEPGYLEFLTNTLLVRYLFSFVMVTLMGAAGWVIYFIRNRQEEQARLSATEKLAREAELSMLRRQLQPHFLFNSLNSINALIAVDPEKARNMVHQLSDFFRGSLKKDGDQLVTLAAELAQMQLYLDIEKVRFGHRLQTTVECDEMAQAMMLPSLLLQPLIENAIKYGLYDTTGEVQITVKATAADSMLRVEITNPFDPDTASMRSGSGFGLASVRRRLLLLYSRGDLLATDASPGIFKTTLSIPQYAT
jgi:signal transduction histidine kinase